jgi:hypothetical protein
MPEAPQPVIISVTPYGKEGGHFQASQNFHPFAAVFAGRLPARQGVHAAHPGRKLRVLDMQFGIHRKLADAAGRTQIVGKGDAYREPTSVRTGLERSSWY